MYGGGIQYGVLMYEAAQHIPACGRVALFNLSWDGGDTVYQARGAAPILVQVMNCNNSSLDSVGLVGYMPQLEVSDATRNTTEFTKAQHHLKQVLCHTYPTTDTYV